MQNEDRDGEHLPLVVPPNNDQSSHGVQNMLDVRLAPSNIPQHPKSQSHWGNQNGGGEYSGSSGSQPSKSQWNNEGLPQSAEYLQRSNNHQSRDLPSNYGNHTTYNSFRGSQQLNPTGAHWPQSSQQQPRSHMKTPITRGTPHTLTLDFHVNNIQLNLFLRDIIIQ